MKDKDLNRNIFTAAKWSSVTEIAVKLITPIINMILARILAPEEFGVVTTATMIVSFANMFSDAGFQKYIVQHEFKSEEELSENANVSFWTNLSISLLLVGVIFIFREQLASIVGNPGLGNVIFVASLQLVLTAFSSIQMALLRRKFDFKSLFYSRMASAIVPLVVTLPLAAIGFSYWSIIIGNIMRQLSDAIILGLKSDWKPRYSFKINILKEMFSFSMWSLFEAISIWLTTWADTFVISSSLNQYYLGLYKNSTSIVNALYSIITGSTTPVLFSSLSRLQNDEEAFNRLFLKFQKAVSVIIFPLGVGVFLYRELATQLLLGNQWKEASDVIGIWALTSSIMVVLGNYCSELYRAKGMPILSLIAQVFHLIFLIPACVISARMGFWPLVYTRSLMRIQFILVHFIIMKFVIKFPIYRIFINIFPATLGSLIMWGFGYFIIGVEGSLIWNIIGIILCAIVYLVIISLFKDLRSDLLKIVKMGKKQIN